MDFLRCKPREPTPIEIVQSIITALTKLEVDLPQKARTHTNIRGIQSAKGILRSLSFRL